MENKKIRKKLEDLPRDIIADIFSRLAIKSLVQSKCISRFHNSLVRLDDFVDLHHGRHCPPPIKFLISTGRSQKKLFYTIDDEFDEGKSSVLPIDKLEGFKYSRIGYAKGLFCLWTENTRNKPVLILNPTTRESRFLPDLHIDINSCRRHYAFGFDPDVNRHKILMTLYEPKMASTRQCWVFTIGVGWREINSVSVTNFYPVGEGACVNGVVYSYSWQRNSSYLSIVGFNFRTEEFSIIKSLWYDFYRYGSCGRHITRFFKLVQLEAKLAAIHPTNSGVVQIWYLQSSGEWVKQDVNHIHVQERYPCRRYAASNNKEMAVMKSKYGTDEIELYNVKEDKWRSIKISGLAPNITIFGIYTYDYCIYSLF